MAASTDQPCTIAEAETRASPPDPGSSATTASQAKRMKADTRATQEAKHTLFAAQPHCKPEETTLRARAPAAARHHQGKWNARNQSKEMEGLSHTKRTHTNAIHHNRDKRAHKAGAAQQRKRHLHIKFRPPTRDRKIYFAKNKMTEESRKNGPCAKRQQQCSS